MPASPRARVLRASRRGTRAVGVFLAALLVLPLVVLAGAPAHAAGGPGADDPGGLELSVDGEVWGEELPGALFPSSVLIVPGGTVATDLWVRNASPERARLEVVVSAAVGVGSGLGGWIRVELEGTPIAGGATWTGPVLDPGQSHRLGISVHLPVEAPNETRADSTPVLDTVRLVGTDAPAPAPVPPDGRADADPGDRADERAGTDPGRGAPGERLAVTGSDLALLGVVALLLALAGAWALRARRRAGAARRHPTGLSDAA